MNEVISTTINGSTLPVKFWEGVPVVTFNDVDQFHNRPDGTARRTFNSYRQHFDEGVDYYKVCANVLRTHENFTVNKRAHGNIILLSESGYLLVAKAFTDKLAWNVQKELVRFYFSLRPTDGVTPAQTEPTVTEQLPSQPELIRQLDVASKLLCQYEMVTRKQKEYISVLEDLVDKRTRELEGIHLPAKKSVEPVKTVKTTEDTSKGYGLRAFAKLCDSNLSTVGVWLENKGYMVRGKNGNRVPADEYKNSWIFNKLPYALKGHLISVNYKISEDGARELARLFKSERRIA